MKNKGLAVFVIFFCLLVVNGCGKFFQENNAPTPVTTSRFVYTANFASGTAGSVSALGINSASGALTNITGSPFTSGNGTSGITVDASNKFLYAADQSAAISAFTISSSTGALTPISGSPFSAGTAPVSVAVTPTVKFLYAANSGSRDIQGFTVDTTSGALTALSKPALLAGTPNHVRIDKSGRFVYVTQGLQGTYVYQINSDGSLTVTGQTAASPCSGAMDIVIDPGTHFAYIADGGTGICTYTVNANNGSLTLIPSSSVVPTGTTPSGMAITPDGKYLYVTNRGSNNIAAFLINVDGTLTAVSGSPFGSGNGPAAADIEQSGNFLYVANFTDNTVQQFTISKTTGALTSNGAVAAGANPTALVVAQ